MPCACAWLTWLLFVRFNLQHGCAVTHEIRHEQSSAISVSSILDSSSLAYLVSEYIFWGLSRDLFGYFEGTRKINILVVVLI